jgi:hypothetical protein
MMEAARTSETSVENNFTRQYNPVDKPELTKLSVFPWIVTNTSIEHAVTGRRRKDIKRSFVTFIRHET